MPKVSKPRSKKVEPQVQAMEPLKVGDNVIFNGDASVIYTISKLPPMGESFYWMVRTDATGEWTSPRNLLTLVAKVKEDITATRMAQPADRQQEPEWVAKIITWEGASGFVRLHKAGTNGTQGELYAVRREAAGIYSWSKVSNGTHGMSIAIPYVTTLVENGTPDSCGCKGWGGHGKCKHSNATAAMVATQGI